MYLILDSTTIFNHCTLIDPTILIMTTEEKVASSDTLTQPLFRDITAEDYDPEITELDSLCVNCEEQVSSVLPWTFLVILIISF